TWWVEFLPADETYNFYQIRITFKKIRIVFKCFKLQVKRFFLEFFYGIVPVSPGKKKGKSIKKIKIFFHFRDKFIQYLVNPLHYSFQKYPVIVLLHKFKGRFLRRKIC